MLEYNKQLSFLAWCPSPSPDCEPCVRVEALALETPENDPDLLGTYKYKQSEIQILQYSKYSFPTADCCLITPGVRGAALTSRMETAALKCGAWVRGPTPQTILAPPQQRPQAMKLFHLI